MERPTIAHFALMLCAILQIRLNYPIIGSANEATATAAHAWVQPLHRFFIQLGVDSPSLRLFELRGTTRRQQPERRGTRVTGDRSLQNRNPCNPLLPLGRASLVDARALAVDSDGDGHVSHVKFVNRLHAEVSEGDQS